MKVLPTPVAPALRRSKTTGAVDVEAEWVLAQSGFPNPVTYPFTSNLIPKLSPLIPTWTYFIHFLILKVHDNILLNSKHLKNYGFYISFLNGLLRKQTHRIHNWITNLYEWESRRLTCLLQQMWGHVREAVEKKSLVEVWICPWKLHNHLRPFPFLLLQCSLLNYL